VNEITKKKFEHPEPGPDAERRKIGTVVHDDRGNASVSWRDAPTDYHRPVLEILGEPGLSIKSEETFDPYAHRAARTSGGSASGATGGSRSGSTSRTDLRKLSEWIKMMRELEQRKRGGDEGESES
jgi:hypothetical protein